MLMPEITDMALKRVHLQVKLQLQQHQVELQLQQAALQVHQQLHRKMQIKTGLFTGPKTGNPIIMTETARHLKEVKMFFQDRLRTVLNQTLVIFVFIRGDIYDYNN